MNYIICNVEIKKNFYIKVIKKNKEKLYNSNSSPSSKELINYCLINNYNFLFKKIVNILNNNINYVKLVSM